MFKNSIKFLSAIIYFIIYKTCGVMLEPKFFSRYIKLNLLSSAVFRAANNGDVNKLRQLIAKGVNVNERQRDGFTPLMLSALKGKSSLVELLIENGADVNVRDKIGYSPLEYAICKKDCEIAQVLISNGADVNATNSQSLTPLMSATVSRDREMAELLLSKGANLSARNADGATPLMMAVLIGAPDLVKLFIEYGADVNDVCDGSPVITMAQYKNNKEILELLRLNGAKGEITGCCPRK